MSNVTQEIRLFMGDGLYASVTLYAIIFSINLMYISARGIKKLDAYFEDGKDYDDTWSFGATFRFFKYCIDFMKGRLKIKSRGIKLWMYFNALGYLVINVYLIVALVMECYFKISSWMS